jgi:replication factor A1
VVPFTPPGEVADTGIWSVKGTVQQVREPRSFTTKSGTPSWVRNIVIAEGEESLRLVLWGDHALVPLAPGDPVEAYHATAKAGRFGGIELGVGRGSVLRVPAQERRPIAFAGTINAGHGCTFIDNDTEPKLIGTQLPHGTEVIVHGFIEGNRIHAERVEPVVLSREDILERISQFRQSSAS